jgi:hypothetical protein
MRKILIIVLSILSLNCFSQHLNVGNVGNVKSPNVSDFVRHGNIPTNMYVGELDLSIPLLSVPVNGQNSIDLSLSYNSSGFVPNKRSGIVGLNWNLMGIPAITREVKGVPDDHIGSPSTLNGVNGRFEHGFMVGMAYLKNNGGVLPNDIIDANNSLAVINSLDDKFYLARYKGITGGSSLADSFETTPDVFSFNVNNLSGKFFMTSDGQIKVVSNSPNVISVDLTNFIFQPYTAYCSPKYISEIKIIDDKGNKYFFGGNSSYLEYSLNHSLASNTSNGFVINTWYIKRIEYYNNEIVYFNFKDDGIGLNENGFCSSNSQMDYFKSPYRDEFKKFFFINEYANDSRSMVNGVSKATGSMDGTSYTYNNGAGFGKTYTLHKKAFLESITNINFSIQFNYSSQGYTFNNNSSLNTFFKNFIEFKLDEIVLKRNSQNIKKINLTYLLIGGNTNSNSYPRLFLNQVTELGKPSYKFEYNINQTTQLPKPSTNAIDHWGFYNGKSNNDTSNQLIAQETFDSNKDATIVSDIRHPDFNYAKIGTINKVIYPTGGYSVFEYEPHSYSQRLERRFANSFLPALYNVVGESGGVRIKKIYDYDGLQNVNIKEYLYTNENNSSSGILMKWPRYAMEYSSATTASLSVHLLWGTYNTITVNTNENRAFLQSSTLSNNSLENSVINYSRVVEKTTNNGLTVYNFTNYNTNPDKNDIVVEQLTSGTYSPENLVKNFHINYHDTSIERGKLSSKLIYDINNSLKFKEEYFYNTNPNRFLQNKRYVSNSNAWIQYYKQYYYNNFLTQTKSTEYTSVGSIETIQNSVYIPAPTYFTTVSNQDILSESSTTSSVNNQIIKTEHTYPWQNYLPGSTMFLNFKNSNIMYPIREIQYRNSVKLSEKFTLFANDGTTNSLMFPKSIYSAKFPNSIANITDIGNLEKKFTYDLYDNKGNILQFTPENGVPTAIIWGYNKTLPIAKIENTLYSSISSTVITNLQSLSDTGTETNLKTALNSLRSSLPNAMITTYTHLPLIGVSTITDPKGDFKTFTYDFNNRLKDVKDKNGNILSDYQYHYKN